MIKAPRTPHLIVKLDGFRMKSDYEVLSVDVTMEANRVPWAEIVLLDGDAAKRKFRISESGDFELGTKVEIVLGYLNEPATQDSVFLGIVTRQAVELDRRGQVLRVECRHAAHLMTKTRRSETYKNKTDSAAIKSLADPYKSLMRLDAGTLTGVEHEELVQFFASDWDFMLARCQANGWLVVPTIEGLKLQDPSAAAGVVESDYQIDFNKHEIFTIELAVDGADQYETATSTAWDYKAQALTAASPLTMGKLGPGKLDPSAIQRIAATRDQSLFSGSIMQPTELKAWATGALVRSRLSFLRGRIEMQGTAKIKPGKPTKIEGIGTRFDGVGLVTAVRQRITGGGWSTDIQVGLGAKPFHEDHAMADTVAGGLLPGVHGLQVGVVQKFEKDEKGGQHRVRVYLPAMGKKENLIWARYATPMAGKSAENGKARGILFWPEEGDEVVVGFLNGDPRAGVVLGALFNGTHAPLYPADADNFRKGIVSKLGSTLEFDDKEKEIILSTKANMELRFNEDKQLATLTDKKDGAKFTLGKQGISMEFKGNKFELTDAGLAIEAGGQKLTLAKSGVAIESSGEFKLTAKGVNIDGGPQVEIKGGMVNLK